MFYSLWSQSQLLQLQCSQVQTLSDLQDLAQLLSQPQDSPAKAGLVAKKPRAINAKSVFFINSPV